MQITDHSMLLTTVESRGDEYTLRRQTIACTNWKKFSAKLDALDVTKYLSESDPDVLTETLLSDLERCLQACYIYIGSAIIYAAYLALRDQYQRMRKNIRKQLREAESRYLTEQIRIFEDPKQAWRVLNEQLRGKISVRRLPTPISGNDPDLQELHAANEYFANTDERF